MTEVARRTSRVASRRRTSIYEEGNKDLEPRRAGSPQRGMYDSSSADSEASVAEKIFLSACIGGCLRAASCYPGMRMFLGKIRKKRVTRVTRVTRWKEKAAIAGKNGIATSRPEAPTVSPTRHQRVTGSRLVPHSATSALRGIYHYATNTSGKGGQVLHYDILKISERRRVAFCAPW